MQLSFYIKNCTKQQYHYTLMNTYLFSMSAQRTVDKNPLYSFILLSVFNLLKPSSEIPHTHTKEKR